MKNKKSRLFQFFDPNRDARMDAVEEDTTPTLKRYFKLLGRKFWKLISLSFLMLPMILPVILVLYFYLSSDRTPIQDDLIFSQLYGANLIDPTPTSTLLLDLFGAQLSIPVYSNTLTYVLMGIAIVFLAVTFGWQNVGVSYILRSFVRGEPVFLFSDYFYAIKRNLKQGFFLGLLDLGAIVLLVFDFIWFSSQPSSFLVDFGYFSILLIALLYFLMRLYLYLMLVTFDLSIKKILKNALIFSVLGIKRNVMAILGLAVVTALQILLFVTFQTTGIGIGIPLMIMLIYYLGVTSFTCAYAAYPVIDRFMIEPYRDPEGDSPDEDDAEKAEKLEE